MTRRIVIELSEEEYRKLSELKGDKTWKDLLLLLLYMDNDKVIELERERKLNELLARLDEAMMLGKELTANTEALELLRLAIVNLVNRNEKKVKEILVQVYEKLEGK